MPISRKRPTRSPALEERFLPPADFEWGDFHIPDGGSLRWGHLPVPRPRAQCVLVGGFGEFIEKHFETIRDLAARHVEVWCLDWRGQGHSCRPRILPTRPRARNFDRDAGDLAAFGAAKLTRPLPRLLIAHSMGGAIGLICVARHPSLFDAAILSSPMIGLRTGKVPPMLLRYVTASVRALGLGLCLLPGVQKWSSNRTRSPDQSRVSADARRCAVTHAWVTANPSLQMSGVTYAWLDSAFALISQIQRPGFLARVHTPVLVGVPECEFVVSSAAQRDAARFLPHCTLVELPESKHDPFLERDKIRDEWLCRIEAFLFEQLSLSLVPADVEQTVQTQAIKVVDKWVLAGRGAFTRRGIKHLRRSSG
jgi:lysophospholipase